MNFPFPIRNLIFPADSLVRRFKAVLGFGLVFTSLFFAFRFAAVAVVVAQFDVFVASLTTFTPARINQTISVPIVALVVYPEKHRLNGPVIEVESSLASLALSVKPKLQKAAPAGNVLPTIIVDLNANERNDVSAAED